MSTRAVENKLRWSLDVIFREDSDLAKKDNAPLNLNILDKFALFLVTQVDVAKISRKRKRYKAALNPEVLAFHDFMHKVNAFALNPIYTLNYRHISFEKFPLYQYMNDSPCLASPVFNIL